MRALPKRNIELHRAVSSAESERERATVQRLDRFTLCRSPHDDALLSELC